jgi:Zn-dependent protease
VFNLTWLLEQFDWPGIVAGLSRVIAVFLCLTIHEVSHGLAAFSLGDPTARSMHRLSLNPLRHIDVLGLILMFAVGFGWAKPVPVNPGYFKNPKTGMALTALAGPVANFMLAFSLVLVSRWIYDFAAYTPAWDWGFQFCLNTAALSIGLGLFNLVPIPPLDGSKVLLAFLPDSVYGQVLRVERYGILVLFLLSFTNVGGGLIGGAIQGVFSAMLSVLYA